MKEVICISDIDSASESKGNFKSKSDLESKSDLFLDKEEIVEV